MLYRLVEEGFTGFAVFVSGLLVKIDAEARLVSHLNVASFDEGLFSAFDKFVEERHGFGMPFKRQEVGRGGAEVHGSHGADRA